MIRPRPGDLEEATRPHGFRPSGEYVSGGRELCDLCGLAQRGTFIHPSSLESKQAEIAEKHKLSLWAFEMYAIAHGDEHDYRNCDMCKAALELLDNNPHS